MFLYKSWISDEAVNFELVASFDDMQEGELERTRLNNEPRIDPPGHVFILFNAEMPSVIPRVDKPVDYDAPAALPPLEVLSNFRAHSDGDVFAALDSLEDEVEPS